MTSIEVLVAVEKTKHDRGFPIGQNGDLPWERIADDMAIFQRETDGETTLMGKDTYQSIPEQYRPFKNRQSIVLTESEPGLDDGYDDDVLTTASSLDNGIKSSIHDRIFIIGGERPYRESLEKDLVDILRVTEVDMDDENITPRFDTYNPDTFFDFDRGKWELIEENPYDGLSYEGFSHKVFQRKD